MGDHEYFSVNNELEKEQPANWVVDGGKISAPYKGFYVEDKYVCVGQKGKPLTFHKKKFKPSSELTIIKYPHHTNHDTAKDRYPNLPKDILELYEEDFISLFYLSPNNEKNRTEKLTSSQLRFLRNLPYARHGHVFTDTKLAKIFNQFVWYFPQPNKKVTLNKKETAFVEYIKGLEK